MQAAPLSRWLVLALLLLIATTLGSNHIAARVAFDHGANVTTAVAVRSSGTVLFVLVLLLASRVPMRLPAAMRWRSLAIGVLLAAQSYCLYSAVARIPVALALLAFNTFPMVLTLLSWAAGDERPARRALVAMPLALAGLALALDVFGLAGGRGVDFAGRWAQIGIGVLWALGASLLFATALFLTARWLKGVDGRVRTLLGMSVVAVLFIAGGALTHSFALPADRTGWIGLVLLTLFYSVGLTALFALLPRIGAVSNTAALNFEPIAVLLIAWPILGQSAAPLQILGALVVVGAIIALNAGRH